MIWSVSFVQSEALLSLQNNIFFLVIFPSGHLCGWNSFSSNAILISTVKMLSPFLAFCSTVALIPFFFFPYSRWITTWESIFCLYLCGSESWWRVFASDIFRHLIIIIPKASEYPCICDWDSNQQGSLNLPLDGYCYSLSLWGCRRCWLGAIPGHY